MMKKNGKQYPYRGAIKVFAQAGGSNPAAVIDGIRSGLQEWQNKQNGEVNSLREQLSAGEKAQAELKQTITELQASYDDMAKKIAAGQMNGAGGVSPEAAARSAAMASYLRSGEINAALTKDGNIGVVAPSEWDRTVTNKLVEISPARKLFNVKATEKAAFTKVYNLHGFTSGWVGETEARPETETGELKSYEFRTGEIYANPAVSQTALDDAEIDVEALVNEEVSNEFAIRENEAFFVGDGVKDKPQGILTFVEGQKNEKAHPLGAIQAVQAKSSGPSGICADDIFDLIGALPSAFMPNAAFMMNRKTMTLARKMKNNMGDYIWQQSMQAGQPNRLLGYPVYEVSNMPDMGSGSIPMLFGDFRRAYLILDRKGIRVLRDPFSHKPYIHFYTTKRTGGGVDNPEAVKAMLM
ncbi:phage major capsid protein [Snodgrassella communis]|uniref:phage major capsid protein n=2 Tax=Snodgrassella communis TaxID=2946699 RepID=UPI001EF4F42C|nr:phage major capsid protein [Snodgrassella communis]